MDEFELIEKFFSVNSVANDVIMGIGDDAAILQVPPNHQLVSCVDTLTESVHFLKGTDPKSIAYKAISVNLSDLAAMGAKARWLTLAITLPKLEQSWLQAFQQGLQQALKEYDVALVGGDTTKGALSVTVQAMGLVKQQQFLSRAGAKAEHRIFVSKPLGEAALGLKVLKQELGFKTAQHCIEALNYPRAELDLGLILKDYASACIDISDGLLADLNHILKASQVGALIDLAQIPLPSADLNDTIKLQAALTGGDDYALCFCVPEHLIAPLNKMLQAKNITIYEIGKIIADKTLMFKNMNGLDLNLAATGFKHFE